VNGRKLGVVLFQLGGPDSLEAIEPFLFNLFSDPDIIDFPLAKLARRPLARLIASRRGKHVAHHYESIGGKSPILDHTQRQARALEASLSKDRETRVTIAMRYSPPFTAEAADEMLRFGADDIVLLPLYPQYSKVTTGSAINEWNRRFHPNGNGQHVRLVEHFFRDAGYIGALAAAVGRELARFPNPSEVDVVFSAHSVPTDVVERGDPYQKHVEQTAELVWRTGGWPGRMRVCYQSKVGPSKWLRPMMRETLEDLAGQGSRQVLMVPVSFVSDHVETLFEIDIEHREIAERAGIEHFRMMPGLNDSPDFIDALAAIVRGGSGDTSK